VWTQQANGVTSVNGATGAVTVVPTFNGSTAAAVGVAATSAVKFRYGYATFSFGVIHLTAGSFGLSTIVNAGATYINVSLAHQNWCTVAFNSTDLYIYSWNASGNDTADSVNAASYQVYGT
jgi:hypothetical protein